MYCVLYVVRCNVVFYYKIDVHVGMLRKKHQWKIAEFQWLDIFVLAKASGWLSGFPVQCVDGWLKSCLYQLASWLPYHRFSVSWAKCEWKHLLWVSGQLWTYQKVRLCVFVCVLLTSPYICGRLWLSAHRASAKLEAFFSFPFLLFGAERHAVLTSWPCSTFLCLIVLSLSHSHMHN